MSNLESLNRNDFSTLAILFSGILNFPPNPVVPKVVTFVTGSCLSRAKIPSPENRKF